MNDADGQFSLDDQIGFLLRRAYQRHVMLFNEHMPPDLTPTQSSALLRLHACGPMSQNRLGRRIAVDASTIKGVVDRLKARGLVTVRPHDTDQRRLLVSLTEQGELFVRTCIPRAVEVARATLEPLDEAERALMVEMLRRLADGTRPAAR